jgi:Zn-dependent protease
MFWKKLKLMKLFGFTVSIDLSWLIVAALVAWSLATGLFPSTVRGLSAAGYWAMGALGVVALLFSIVVHELAHAVAARRLGMSIKGITLFVFGGIAEMERRPPNARTEGLMAALGPLASFFVAGASHVAALGLGASDAPDPVVALLEFTAVINALLGAFNLIPAFPLDGGRVLRAVIWGRTGKLLRATRIASWIGTALAVTLVVIGVTSLVAGMTMTGIWWSLIGLFIYSAARRSYRETAVELTLEKQRVSRFARSAVVTVRRGLPVDRFVEDYLLQEQHRHFPVVDLGGSVLGYIGLDQVKQIPKEAWDTTTAGELAARCDETVCISSDASAAEALASMRRASTDRLMVVDDDELVGIVKAKDLLGFATLRLDLDRAA